MIVVGERVGVGCRHDATRTIEYVIGVKRERMGIPANVSVHKYTSPTPHKYEFPQGVDCLIIQSGMGTPTKRYACILVSRPKKSAEISQM